MSDKLLPCPFCGGEALMRERYINGVANTKHYRHECRGCKATFANWYRSIKKANEAWNRRAQPDNEPLTLDELKQMDGEPVWTITKGVSSGHWEIIKTVNDKFIYLCDTREGIYDLTIATYGKTWLAYRHKPERSEG